MPRLVIHSLQRCSRCIGQEFSSRSFSLQKPKHFQSLPLHAYMAPWGIDMAAQS
jgi:hypothetical protein